MNKRESLSPSQKKKKNQKLRQRRKLKRKDLENFTKGNLSNIESEIFKKLGPRKQNIDLKSYKKAFFQILVIVFTYEDFKQQSKTTRNQGQHVQISKTFDTINNNVHGNLASTRNYAIKGNKIFCLNNVSKYKVIWKKIQLKSQDPKNQENKKEVQPTFSFS